MTKRTLFIGILISIVIIIVSSTNNAEHILDSEAVTVVEKSQIIQLIHEVEAIEEELKNTEPEPVIQINDNDAYELCKIAMAEAEGEDVVGKAHVMMVVLNRVNNKRFPNTIHGVIYQKNQFTPVRSGRYNSVKPNAECYEALNMITYGWDESNGALYFESCKNANNWHSRNLQYLFKHGRHRFYK